MRSQSIHNVVKCRSTHSEVVTEFPLIFSDSPIKRTVSAFKCPCGYNRMLLNFSFSPIKTLSPPEMKQTQQIKSPIPHASHVDCSASLTKLTALQAPIPILSVCVCTPDLGSTGGNNDIAADTDTDIVGACTPALTLHTHCVLYRNVRDEIL